MTNRCPMCGSAVRIVSGDDGTNHYIPVVSFTESEVRAMRLAMVFGVPEITPPDIASARKKLRMLEQEASK